jgi:hypothetical protein
MPPTPVYLEVGAKRVFAATVDWPGWCRSGRSEEDALDQLAAYAPRYAEVAAAAGVPPPDADSFTVVERVKGDGTTDFGAPGKVPALDAGPLGADAAGRMADLVAAAWTVFDRIAADSPAEMRKGPRGGGRDRDKMIEHVLGAEASYARQLGVKHKQPALDDRAAIMALREAILAALVEQPSEAHRWPVPYAARRIAWHVLDHAWEMQDKAIR